jgi:hypothetical protein
LQSHRYQVEISAGKITAADLNPRRPAISPSELPTMPLAIRRRAGLVLGGGTTIKPFLSAYYVHEFLNTPGAFGANFVGGVGPNALFALAGRDKDWGEVSGGLSVDTGQVTLSASAETTIGRDDVTYQSYRGSIKFHF